MDAARSLIVAPRLPPAPQEHRGDPFATLGDVVLDCDVPGCGWHAMGPRADAKKAYDAHYRLNHSEEIGVVLLNHPRQ